MQKYVQPINVIACMNAETQTPGTARFGGVALPIEHITMPGAMLFPAKGACQR
jgi:hypothetical protein